MTTFTQFLTAKRTVEDRALNRVVFKRFVDELAVCATNTDEPIRIVEIGVGTGSMIARLAEWNALPPKVSYRALDIDSETLALAHQRLPNQLQTAGYAVETTDTGFRARRSVDDGPDQLLDSTLAVGDGFEVDDRADAVIASAVLDLVALDSALDSIQQLLVDGGLLYAPFTFNGHTSFRPPHPQDGTIEKLYHRHMDEIRVQPGHSRAGQQLLTALPAAGYSILEAGGADWVVHPADGEYPSEESTVLEHLLSTIEGALADYAADILSPSARDEWIETRRRQLTAGELTLVAHHMDVLARR